MAMETIGLGGRLSFDPSQGVQGMGRAAKAYEDMARRSQRAAGQVQTASRGLKESLGKAGEGMRTVGMAAMPMSVGMGFGIAKAASFEKQMSNVRSILRGASEQEFAMLQDEAKRLGIVSVFSAQQAGEAIENLAVLGMKPLEIMQAIGPTLDAAAVAGIGLGEAALYVGGSTRAMGLAMDQTARVADVLTAAGQESGTTLPLMAEALKYAASSAVQADMSLEETVSILGKLADAQHRGTAGGTAFVNMMNKLTGPTKEAEKLLADMNVTLTDSEGALRPIRDIVMDVKEGLDEESNAALRLAKAQEIFGLRGVRAFSALSIAGSESTKELQTKLENSMGAAQEAAEKRLDNILGAFTLFGASLEGVAIGLFTPFLEEGKHAIGGLTNALNDILLVMGELRAGPKEGEEAWEGLLRLQNKYGESTVEMARGITDAVDLMTEAFHSAIDTLREWGMVARDAFGGDSKRELTKFAVLMAFTAAIAAPLMLGIAGMAWAFKGMGLILGPIPKAIGLVIAALKWMSVTTIPMAIAALKQLFWYAAMNAALWLKGAIAMFAALAPLLLLAAGLYGLYKALETTQMAGETFIESLVKNYKVGLGQIQHWLIKFKTWIQNLILKPMQWVAKAWIKLQEARGKKVSEQLRQFTQVKFEAPKKWVPLEERAGPIKRTAGRGVGARLATEALPYTAKTGAGWDVMGELEEQIGEVSMGRTDKWYYEAQKLLGKMVDTSEATQKAAEEAAKAALREKCAKLNLDGREVARSVAKHQREIEARSGFKATPYQRSRSVVTGALPARG